MTTATSSNAAQERLQSGFIAGLAAYLLWGFLPILFKFLETVPPATVVANRTLWSLLLVGGVLLALGRRREIAALMADWRNLRAMAISSLVLAFNWLVFVYAVETGELLQAAFGYFITPLANVALGMVLLGERQNRWQAVSIGIAAVAIGIQAVGLSGVPWIALALAFSFAAYGFFRKTAKAGTATGLCIETLLLSPLALVYLGYTFLRDGGVGPHADPVLLVLLLATGPATAVPLLLFGYAVQRLRLTTIGMLQYIAPSIAFVLAITLFGEPLNLVRLLSFILIWLSLLVFTTDSVLRRRHPPALP